MAVLRRSTGKDINLGQQGPLLGSSRKRERSKGGLSILSWWWRVQKVCLTVFIFFCDRSPLKPIHFFLSFFFFKAHSFLDSEGKLLCSGIWGKWRFETALGAGGKTGLDVVLGQHVASSGSLIKSPEFLLP